MEYPVQFSVDYPDRPLNRLTTAYRIFLVIPIVIVLGTVNGGGLQLTMPSHSYGVTAILAGAGACFSSARCS
jgi:hypothetical protein